MPPKVTAKAAQRCLNGGLAAGILACHLDALQKEVVYANKISFSTAESLLLDSEKQAKILRRSFGSAREDVKEIQATLKQWNKDLKKNSRYFPRYVHKESLGKDVSKMKGKLQKILDQGRRAGGSLERLPYEVTSALTDWAAVQARGEKVTIKDILPAEPEKETVPTRGRASQKAATVGRRR